MRYAIPFSLAAMLVTLSACVDDPPTGPARTAEGPPSAPPSLSAAEAAALGAAVEDARDRLLPSLSDASRAAEIDAAFGALLTGIAEAGESDSIRSSLDRARAALGLAAADRSDVAQLAAMGLVLNRVERLLLPVGPALVPGQTMNSTVPHPEHGE